MGFGRPLRPQPPRADVRRVWPEGDWWAEPTPSADEAVRRSTSVTNDRA